MSYQQLPAVEYQDNPALPDKKLLQAKSHLLLENWYNKNDEE